MCMWGYQMHVREFQVTRICLPDPLLVYLGSWTWVRILYLLCHRLQKTWSTWWQRVLLRNHWWRWTKSQLVTRVLLLPIRWVLFQTYHLLWVFLNLVLKLLIVPSREKKCKLPPAMDAMNWIQTHGTITCGTEQMHVAWPCLCHVFSVHCENDVQLLMDSSTEICYGSCPSSNLLQLQPVDLLVVECGFINCPWKIPSPESWEKLVNNTDCACWPKVILESWRAHAVNWENGPMGKAAHIQWELMGFESHFWWVLALDLGGALNQSWILVALVQRSYVHQWTWNGIQHGICPCTMSNLLTPGGLLPHQEQQVLLKAIIHHLTMNPMPDHVGAWIQTEKCTHWLTREELGWGLCIPRAWDYPSLAINPQYTTNVFHWEYVCHSFILEADTEEWLTLKLLRPVDLPESTLLVDDVDDETSGEGNFFL